MGLLQCSCETIVILSLYCRGIAVGFLLDCCDIHAALLTHIEARLTDNYQRFFFLQVIRVMSFGS